MADKIPLDPEYQANLFASSLIEMDLPYMAESMRDFANQVHAGDHKVSWTLLTEIGDKELYGLGSHGTFFHPTYGSIKAMYVRYSDSLTTLGNPVGLDMRQLGKKMVTDQYPFSHPAACMGLSPAYVLPTANQFGWVIINGINLIETVVEAPIQPEVGEWVSWDQTGRLFRAWNQRVDSFAQICAPITESLGAGLWKVPPASLRIQL